MQNEQSSTPTSACTLCHKRKVRCDRLPNGCSNCRRSTVPCIYPSVDELEERNKRRKSRGPYRKDKTVREKELEHVVGVLQAKCDNLNSQLQNFVTPESIASTRSYAQPQAANYRTRQSPGLELHTPAEPLLSPSVRTYTGSDHTCILDLWLVFQSFIHSATKIVHVPSISGTLLALSDDDIAGKPGLEFLLSSISYASLRVMQPEQVFAKFRKSRDDLLNHYQRLLDGASNTTKSSRSPDLMMLQALVLYLAVTRGIKGIAKTRASYFGLAVHIAQLLGIDQDRHPIGTSTLEIELRRRCWWSLCRFEIQMAEKIRDKHHTVMKYSDVPLPGNFDDIDLESGVFIEIKPRTGITDMSLVLLIFEGVRLTGRLQKLMQQHPTTDDRAELQQKAIDMTAEHRALVERQYLSHCDASRAYDWLLLLVAKSMVTKVEIMMLEQPNTNNDLPESAVSAFTDTRIALSLDVIECHQIVCFDPILHRWRWSFGQGQQTYAIARVLKDLAERPQSMHSTRAWAVIDMLFSQPDFLKNDDVLSESDSELLELYQQASRFREAMQDSTTSQIYEPGDSEALHPYEGNRIVLPENIARTTPSTGPFVDVQASMRDEIWQLDHSLLDVQGIEFNMNMFI